MKTELDHLPERKQQELRTIATIVRDTLDDFIVGKTGHRTEFRIVKIILFGSHAKGTWVRDLPNGYISDYDILVIVNKPSLVEEHEIWQRVEEQVERRVTTAPMGLIVHTLHEVNKQLQQGHYFFADIRKEGIELYSMDNKELAEPGNLSEEEAREIAQQHYEQWYESASDFLDGYGFYRSNKRLKMAAFHLHQTAERLYSCALLVLTNYLPKTHNLEKLAKLCVQLDDEFATLFPMDSQFHRRSFRRLQRAYVDARYSQHYQITEEELDYLQGEVEKLKTLVETTCQARLA